MASQIRPNRIEISDRFPMIGFTIHADGGSKSYEVAIATDPSLFKPDARARRTRSNFYSSRARGPVTAARGEAVYLLPADVVARFIGQDKLYYGLAAVGDKTGDTPSIPTDGSPYISLKGLSERALRRVRILPNRQQIAAGYGVPSPKELEWAGDVAQPDVAPVAVKGNGAAAPSAPAPAAGGSAAPANGVAHAAALADYDDGYGPLPAADTGDGGTASAADDDAPTHAIDWPIPDDTPGDATAASASALAGGADAPEYPQASRFVPAASVNYRHVPGTRTISRIVIHITEATTIGSTIGWFQDPAQRINGNPVNVSAHYVVGRDGEVVQMVHHNDVAWHAHSANGDSIGIEHVAKAGRLNPTQAEYCASAALVAWLCDTYGIPVDRTHILGHSEADPHTSHVNCPNAVWDWDYYMHLVTTRSCDAQNAGSAHPAAAQGLAAASQPAGLARTGPPPAQHHAHVRATALGGQSYTLNWDGVELIPQPTGKSCWAAAAAMVIGWRDQMSLTPETIASICGRTTATGLNPAQVESFAHDMGLAFEPPQSYTIDAFRQLLEDHGPLWVCADVPGLHAIVVTGMYGDGADDGSDTYVRISDPWDRVAGSPGAPGPYQNTHATGSRYILRWADFVSEYESAATMPNVNLQILHPDNALGRQPNRGRPADYAMAAALAGPGGTDARYRSPRAHALDVPPPLEPGDVATSGGRTYVVFANEVRSGGVPAWRNHNPGNITAGKWADAHGAYAGKRNGGFAIFPDDATGFDAVIAFIGEHASDTIFVLMSRYAPADDGKNPMLKGNDPQAYARAIAARLGVPVTTPISALDDGQRRIFASEIQRIETGPNGAGTSYAYDDAALPADIRSRLSAPAASTPDAGAGGQDAASPDADAGAGDAGASQGLAYAAGATPQARAHRHARAAHTLTLAEGASAPNPAAPPADPPPRAVPGATLDTQVGEAGSVTWALDQLHGMKSVPGADAANRPLVDGPTIRIADWPYLDDPGGQRVCAHFFVDWHFDGRSVGDVQIVNVGASDAPGHTLHVSARIDDDPQLYPPAKPLFGALRVHFAYRFVEPDASVHEAATELHLFGDGSYEQASHWAALAA
ncbi:N-acetylmuramoyl-L-alanine amidase [Burkholderia ubonensis]|uniref:N-acetylmuramoyl-L-alanine amidase n=1 Tax=Burkholderia ubonensis subsp. mesacidophila TaxID=265293 RepID=A0A2A4EWJ0_9BURK|nr:N-acetylmuramoyl-L-alanine amidase [Burkholderia ubonensis]PCE24674.1 hypothetical protein BZL54_32520 [Burkholderia ubonensis subsp. mesacidophila]